MLLGDAVEFLDDKETVEIRRNGNGHIFIRRFGSDDIDTGLKQSENDALQLGALVAAISGLEFTRNSPSLEFILPFHGARFSVIGSPIQASPMWAVRKRIGRTILMDEYRHAGMITNRQYDQIEHYIKEGRPILVVAPQGEGKTTFLQAILCQVLQRYPSTFFGIVEDTPEINLPTKNKFEWLTCERIGYDFRYLNEKQLRFGAGSLSMGEIRKQPDALLESWGTGYRTTGAATIHGKDAIDALFRLEQLHVKEKVPIDRRYFKNSLGGIVVLGKIDGKPRVKNVTHIESISATNEYRLYKAA
jgi:type IV secretion system protein VirB11